MFQLVGKEINAILGAQTILIWACALYSIITHFDTLKISHIENIMENGAFALLEQMLIFQNIFKSIRNLT